MYLSEDNLELRVSMDEELLFELVMRICSTRPVLEEDRYGSCLRVLDGLLSFTRFEQTVERDVVEPPLPIIIDLF